MNKAFVLALLTLSLSIESHANGILRDTASYLLDQVPASPVDPTITVTAAPPGICKLISENTKRQIGTFIFENNVLKFTLSDETKIYPHGVNFFQLYEGLYNVTKIYGKIEVSDDANDEWIFSLNTLSEKTETSIIKIRLVGADCKRYSTWLNWCLRHPDNRLWDDVVGHMIAILIKEKEVNVADTTAFLIPMIDSLMGIEAAPIPKPPVVRYIDEPRASQPIKKVPKAKKASKKSKS